MFKNIFIFILVVQPPLNIPETGKIQELTLVLQVVINNLENQSLLL